MTRNALRRSLYPLTFLDFWLNLIKIFHVIGIVTMNRYVRLSVGLLVSRSQCPKRKLVRLLFCTLILITLFSVSVPTSISPRQFLEFVWDLNIRYKYFRPINASVRRSVLVSHRSLYIFELVKFFQVREIIDVMEEKKVPKGSFVIREGQFAAAMKHTYIQSVKKSLHSQLLFALSIGQLF